MKLIRASLLAAVCLSPLLATARTTDNFDSGWRFHKADAAGAEQNNFNDAAWQKLDVPHDWSIEGPFAATNKTGGAGAFLPGGIGWYRKHFSLPKDDAGKCVFVEFDGVMHNSDVWINGFHLGHRPNGYVSFSYELTGHLNFGGDNVIAVRADTSAQPASRWYAGAGIYRHVRLVVTEPIHIAKNGVFVSTPKVSATEVTVRIETSVINESAAPREITVQTKLVSPAGKTVASVETAITATGTPASGPARSNQNLRRAGSETGAPNDGRFIQQIIFPKPQLWKLDDPKLYSMVSEVRAGEKVLDAVTNSFGIRDAHFAADTGFWLNGKNFKLSGVCLHADGGAFGAAVPLAIWEARLKALKTLGVNAIRTAHNPPAPEFLDLCDRLGLLVMDEFFDCWTMAKTPFDYHLYFDEWSKTDERDTILRDRNHPSVILYSVGNEIHDTPQAEKAKRSLRGLVDVAHAADPTRPVTQALFRPNVSHDYDDGLADLLDVVGQNYREQEILAAHAQKPSRKILGTENTHDRKQWTAVRDHAPYAGQFLWTGIDYLGEARKWPTVGHGSGLLDRTGAIRPLARERQSWWSATPMIAVNRRVSSGDLMPTDPGYGGEERHTQVVFADWTPRSLEPHNETVEVYANGKEVELFLNGQSLGQKEINADASPRNWQVPFAPGVLKAVATDETGKVVATDELRTAGRPAKIVLATETKNLSPDFDDVAIVRAKITDADGIEIPRARDFISFQVSGPGVIAAVDNGDNASHELFQTNSRQAYQGECVAFVKATGAPGKITVIASATGLEKDSASFITVEPEISK
jgi:beta-galactosidase